MNAAVVYFDVQKVKRGYYQLFPILISENPKEEPEFEITRKYFATLEKSIKERPEFYLWSHKRWKYTRKFVEEQNERLKTH